MTMSGFAVNPDNNEVFMQPNKYLLNLFADANRVRSCYCLASLALFGIGKSIMSLVKRLGEKGIWFAEQLELFLTVLALLLMRRMEQHGLLPIFGRSTEFT
jgi:hypothetical protein